MTDQIRRAVASKVHKEYKSFIENMMKKGARYAIENALKIAFYKEIHTYVLNGILDDAKFEEMSHMDEILRTLWARYVKNSVFSNDTRYLNQLMEFHRSNRVRVEECMRRKR